MKIEIQNIVIQSAVPLFVWIEGHFYFSLFQFEVIRLSNTFEVFYMNRNLVYLPIIYKKIS